MNYDIKFLFLPYKHYKMSTNPKFAVIGGGSWATAIAKMLCHNLDEIAWYMRSESAIEEIKLNKHNPNYLSSVEFDTDQLSCCLRRIYCICSSFSIFGSRNAKIKHRHF